MRSLFAFLLKHCDSPPVLFIGLLLGGSLSVQAIPLETVYPAPEITWTCSSDSGTGITGTPIITPIPAQPGDDCISGVYKKSPATYTPESISFPFKFYGTDYSDFYIYTNGFISLGAIPQTPDKYFLSPNKDIPSTGTSNPNNIIAPFWDDILFNFGGGKKTIYYKTQNTLPEVGDPSKKQLIVQWTSAEFYTTAAVRPPLGTFQAILYENTNGANPTCDIRLQYRQLIGTKDNTFGKSASIGAENFDGTVGAKHSYNTKSLVGKTLTQNKAICLKWNGSNNYTVTDTTYDPVYLAPPPDPPPAIPEIIAPSLECPVNNPTFTWQPGAYVPPAVSSVDSYTLIVSTNPDFTVTADVLLNQGAIPGSTTSYATTLTLVAGTDYYAAVIAKNTHGETWSDIKKCTATATNTPPWISTPSDVSVEVGDSIAAPTFTIGDNETAVTCVANVTIAATNNPASLLASTPTSTGAATDCNLNITPTVGASGKSTITLTVTDAGLKTAQTTFNVIIKPKVTAVPNQNINAGSPVNFTVSALGSNLTYTLNNPPAGASINPTTGAFTWTPSTPGTYTITVIVSDPVTSISLPVNITVTVSGNTPPTISDITDQVTTVNTATSIIAFTVDDTTETAAGSLIVTANSDNTALIPNSSANITLGGSGSGSRTVTVTPVANKSGKAKITVTVDDDGNPAPGANKLTAIDTFYVTVKPSLNTISAQTVNLGNTVSFTAVGIGSNLEYSLSSEPAGATIDPLTGAFSWTPSSTGNFSATVIVTDTTTGESANQPVSITVNTASPPPPPPPTSYGLTIKQDGTGKGTVTGTGSINCVNGSGTCYRSYTDGTSISLTATADADSEFAGWSAGCSDSFSISENLTCTVTFNLKTVAVTITKPTNGKVSAPGLDCGTDCTESLAPNTMITLMAEPNPGFVFTGWSGDCAGDTNPLTLTVDKAKNCQVVFTQIQRTLNLNIDKYGTVTGASGLTCPMVTFCSASYSDNETLTLTAVADTGYTFTGWDGDCSGTDATITLTMNSDKTCHAKMVSTSVPMLVIANPTQGKVTGLDIDCGTTCSATYSEPKTVQLTATPEPGYSFTGWSGDCSGTDNPLTINVNGAKNCVANFAPTPVTLTLTPPTHGKITAPGLDCGTSCSQTLPPDTEIPLTATPEPGYIFTGWSGDCAGTENPLTITLDKAKNCRANFAPISLPILVVTNPTQGTVTGSGIDCGTTCTAAYPGATTATLTATPAPGYTFTGWSGDCSGSENPLSIEVNSGKTCTANFEPILVPLNVTKPTNGKVSIPGLDCSNGCSTNLPQNSPVTITTTPDPGFVFAGWSGDCAGTSNPLTLTLDAAKNCTPIFAPESKPMIIVANPTEGTVSGSGLECGTICTKTFDAPTTITLTATPKPGFVFTGWSGDCSGTENPLTIEVSKAKSCKANFAPVMLPVTLPKPSNGKVSAPSLNCDTTTCSGTYPQNSTVTLTATPDPGFVFTGWTGDCSGMENPLTIQVDKAKNCQATFSPIAQPVLVIPELDNGTVTGDKIEPCDAACVRPFPQIETVTLTATPDPGYIFTGWSGDCSGMVNPITVTIDKATTCIPTFTPAPLVVKISKPNNGKVKGLGIDCGEDCTENYPYGSMITLTAIPEDGYMFVGWSGICSGTTNPITVQAELAAQCVPLFAKYTSTPTTVYSLITGDTDTSQGTVRSEPAGIECGNDCYQQYSVVTSVQLTAIPNDGFAFREWSGNCSGTAAVTTVQVDAVKNCRAYFDPVTQPPMQPSVLEVTIKVGETQQHSIKGGQSPRIITQLPDSTLVDVFWDSPADLLTITGKVVGKTQLIITDGLQRTAIVNITVIPGCRYNMIGLNGKGEVMDGGFNCITPQVNDLSPNCRNNSVGIDAEGKPIFSHSCFSNHVKTRAAVASNRVVVPDAYPMTQVLDFSATITVDPRFIGQKAEVLMVAYSAIYGREDTFMRDGDTWVDWDNKPESLKTAQIIDKLPSQFDVQIYTGNLNDLLGDAAVYVGYRLENGDIYYNGVEPIRFQIGNSASVDPALNTEKNVNSNEVNAGSYFESITGTPDGRQNNHQVFTNREALSLVTYLLVDKKHVGQSADILMVAVHQPHADKGLSFQRIGETWTRWDEKIPSLQPAEHFDKLPDTLQIPIYMGSLSELPGEFVVYVGYRLSNGVIVFNGLSPHHFVVSNALGRDKDGNWTEPTARFINSVNYRDAIHSSGQLTAQEQVGVYSSIWVDPKHIGQKADISMVMLRSTDGEHYASYQRNLEQWEQWDEQQVSLKATIPNVTLEPLMKDLQIFSGQLEPGNYLMYIGYRLPNGEVVYNGGEEIRIVVSE